MANRKCKICTENCEEGQEITKLGGRGMPTLINAMELKGANIEIQPGDTVHKICRMRLADTRNIEEPVASTSGRQRTTVFDFRCQCLFCGVYLAK